MSVTRGGVTRRKQFTWYFDANSQKVCIENEDGRKHSYSVQEIQFILTRLHDEFGDRYFPLANNVEWLSKGKAHQNKVAACRYRFQSGNDRISVNSHVNTEVSWRDYPKHGNSVRNFQWGHLLFVRPLSRYPVCPTTACTRPPQLPRSVAVFNGWGAGWVAAGEAEAVGLPLAQ